MRKTLLSISLSLSFFVFTTSTFSQSLELTFKGGVVNGDTIVASGDPSAAAIAVKVDVANTTGTGIDVQCKRYELEIVPGTTNFYCWFVCYDNSITGTNPHTVAGHFWNIPGMGSLDDIFAADHEPNGNAGLSKYRYCFFDVNNPSDSSCVDIFFDVTVGLEELQNSTKINLFPNPASDQVVLEFNNSRGFKGDKVQIVDMLGSIVKTVDLENKSQGKTVLSIADLNNGVYFCSLIGENGVLGTRRLVISK